MYAYKYIYYNKKEAAMYKMKELGYPLDALEASGWCILAWIYNFNKLEILQCEKHQNLTIWGCKPILVLEL